MTIHEITIRVQVPERIIIESETGSKDFKEFLEIVNKAVVEIAGKQPEIAAQLATCVREEATQETRMEQLRVLTAPKIEGETIRPSDYDNRG